MSLRAVVVDDEPPARAKLRRYLAAAPDIVLCGEAGSGREALAVIAQQRPDVLFLDVRMPEMDGLALLQALGDPLPTEVIFVTAHGDYALQAFEVHAFDYLLKPVSPDRFERLLRRLRERLAPRQDLAARLDCLLDDLPTPAAYVEHVLVQGDGRGELVPAQRISRIEANRNYLTIHADGHRHRLRGTLERMRARLDPARFIQVNRSTLVRLTAIDELKPWPDGEYRLLLDDGGRVTWTRRYLQNAPPGLLLRA